MMMSSSEAPAHLPPLPSPERTEEIVRALAPRLLAARVIGVGEHAHGDTVSWHWREAILNFLSSRGFEVIVACEQADAFLENFRGQRLEDLNGDESSWSWWPPPPASEEQSKDTNREEDRALFYPHLLPFSCYHPLQLEFARRMSRIASASSSVSFVGIDVQQLSFPALRTRMSGLLRRHGITRETARAWTGAHDTTRRRGALRNRLNAHILVRLAETTRQKKTGAREGDDNNIKVLYFAQNEHVATRTPSRSASPSSSSSSYVVEGQLTSDMLHVHVGRGREAGGEAGGGYFSVATVCPELWHTWGGPRPCLRKTRFPADVMSGMRRARDGTVLLLPAAADASRPSFEFEDYGIGHFDAVIAQRRSPAFDGQDPIPRRKRRERGY